MPFTPYHAATVFITWAGAQDPGAFGLDNKDLTTAFDLWLFDMTDAKGGLARNW